jgi:hypothetical protein
MANFRAANFRAANFHEGGYAKCVYGGIYK